jgi:hypothetical protein
MNVLMGVVCGLVPLVGNIVYSGYLFEVIDGLHDDPDHHDFPDFDFNRFMTYLMRGLWPFLAELIFAMVLVVPACVVACAPVVVAAIAFRDTSGAIAVGGAVTVLLAIVFTLGITVLILPAYLHAGLARELRFGELVSFVISFAKRMWKEIVVATLFLAITGPMLSAVGALLFCIGMNFAEVWVDLAVHHLLLQMYELYLKRGGAPVRRAGESELGTVEAV